MTSLNHRLFTPSPDNEPQWVRLYVHDIDGVWPAMLVAEGKVPPELGTLKRLGPFGGTREEAEEAAKTSLGRSEPGN